MDLYFPWNMMEQNLRDTESPSCCEKVEEYLVAAPCNPKGSASAEQLHRVYVRNRPAAYEPSKPPRCRVEAGAFGLPVCLRCREDRLPIRENIHIQADPLSKKRD